MQHNPTQPQPTNTKTARKWIGVTTLLFFALRIYLWANGLTYILMYEPTAQLDPKSLAHNPFEAFTSNNIQPPLWNFALGALAKWSPFPTVGTLQTLFVTANLITVIALWFILNRLGFKPWITTIAVTLVGWSPVMISYENVMRYETFTATIITLSVLTFIRYLENPTSQRLGIFSVTLVSGVLTRATLSPIWFLGALVIALLATRHEPKQTPRLLVCAAAVALITIPLAHRYTRFGVIGFSSYSGMNLSRTSTLQLPDNELKHMVATGQLSKYALQLPFSTKKVMESTCNTPGPAILHQLKMSDNQTNLNDLCYLGWDKHAMKDALTAIKTHPGIYLSSVKKSAALFATWEISPRALFIYKPGTNQPKALTQWTNLYHPLTGPVRFHYNFGKDPQPALKLYITIYDQSLNHQNLSLTLIAAFLFALGNGIISLWHVHKQHTTTRHLTRIYLAYTIFAISIVSITMDSFENARFRIPLDPIILGPFYAGALTGILWAINRARHTLHAFNPQSIQGTNQPLAQANLENNI